jgi:tRNA-2-methylthio-N6-dimethylallyladenosine synthase
MHRIYTKEQYFEKVAMLREIVPNVSLGTDIIVGFPTETEEEFLETYQAVKDIRYSVGFFYSYSPRKGTPAMRWKDDIPEEVKADRLQRLLDLQASVAGEIRATMLGQTYEVLVERFNKDGKMLKGRTRCWKKVIFEGPESLIGTFQQVKMNSFSYETLIGEMVPQNSLKII